MAYRNLAKNINFFVSTQNPGSLVIAFTGLALVFLGTGGVFLFFAMALQSKGPWQELKIGGNAYLTEEELIKLVEIREGKQYSARDFSRMAERLLANPVILQASVHQAGQVVHIDIEERKCVALVFVKQDASAYDVDASGRILSGDGARCKNVPLLRGDFKRSGLEFKDDNVQLLLGVLESISQKYPDLIQHFSELNLAGGKGLTIFLSRVRLRIELLVDMDDEKIRRLRGIVAYLLDKKITDAWVDLRGSEFVLHMKR